MNRIMLILFFGLREAFEMLVLSAIYYYFIQRMAYVGMKWGDNLFFIFRVHRLPYI